MYGTERPEYQLLLLLCALVERAPFAPTCCSYLSTNPYGPQTSTAPYACDPEPLVVLVPFDLLTFDSSVALCDGGG